MIDADLASRLFWWFRVNKFPFHYYRLDDALSPRWNPFRKKSGLMGVMHAQTKKGRLVSKHGRINTIRRKDELKDDQHRWRTAVGGDGLNLS